MAVALGNAEEFNIVLSLCWINDLRNGKLSLVWDVILVHPVSIAAEKA